MRLTAAPHREIQYRAEGHGRSGSRDDPDSRASARVSIQARPAKRLGEKGARLLWTPEIKARAALYEMSDPPGWGVSARAGKAQEAAPCTPTDTRVQEWEGTLVPGCYFFIHQSFQTFLIFRDI